MKCSKCRTKNINQANYCKKCGKEFTDKERKIAVRWTPVWILEKIEKGISILKGDFKITNIITDTKAFKILSLLVVLGVGIFMCVNNGRDVKIEESENYSIQYNTKTQEYYIFVHEKETDLNMYIPNNVSAMVLKHCDKNGAVLEEKEIERTEEIILEAQDDDYYLLDVQQGNKSVELKMFVYLGGGD